MSTLNIRQILVSTLVGVLLLYSASLFFDNQQLLKQKRNLLKESSNLQTAISIFRAQNHELLQGFQRGNKDSQDIAQTIEVLKKENDNLAAKLKKISTQIDSIREEKAYLEEMLINKTKQIDILKNGARTPNNTVTSVESDSAPIQEMISEKEEELRRLNEQNRVLQGKLDRLYKTTNEKMTEINVAKIALSDTVSGAQKKIEDEYNTVNLGTVSTKSVSTVASTLAPDSSTTKPAAEKKRETRYEGHVLAINNEHGFVVIDLGKSDNLSNDSSIEVFKNGQSVAELSVLEIRDAMAACNIKELRDGQRIEINDPVSVLR